MNENHPCSTLDAPFYFVRNGKAACQIVFSERPFPPEIYEEVTPPNPVIDTPERQYAAIWALANRIKQAIGVDLPVRTVQEAGEFDLPRAVLGKTLLEKPAWLGEATSYQYRLARIGGDLFTLARTPGGYLEAIYKAASALVISEDGREAYIPAQKFGVYDRILGEVRHAFPHFTVSIYGNPGREEDEKVFNDLLDFGVDMMPLKVDMDDPASVSRVRGLIRKFFEKGVTTRLYACKDEHMNAFIDQGDRRPLEENIRRMVEAFGDMEGVAHWGVMDEPETSSFEYLALVRRLFDKYDQKKRPLYINLGPRAHAKGVQSFYDRLNELVRLDYFCLDRYPFFMTERGAEMDEDYFYAHFELNRNNAIDSCVDAGMILAAIRVGADPQRADITQDFMDWQTNLLPAYGHRYLEQYVYYYVHDYCILGPNQEPTWRWHVARKANDYLHVVCGMLEDKRLDAVFHLPGENGDYDIGTTPYYGYRGVGEAIGVDAILSFYDDGTLIVTDKRCDPFDGGDHEVTLVGLTGDMEWFNPMSAVWEDIGSCPALRSAGEKGLTLRLARATQYIVRAKA